ncbi:MAG: hypothetical protein K8I27_10500 [Planctomycetes bacterium]|nr:hypothetical protein [Planctomycetota bacterium]
MLKLLNILIVAYLAIAPGMNVEAFIHSVNLCRVTAPKVMQEPVPAACAHAHCPTSQSDDTREQSPQDQEPDSCPHLGSNVAPVNAMPAAVVQSFDMQACPVLVDYSPLSPPRAAVSRPINNDAHPPPTATLKGITILLV